MRPVLGVLGMLAFGWALVSAADARHASVEPEVVYQVLVREVEAEPERTWADAVQVATPVIDSLMDEGWEERMDRESDCLFEFLRAHLGYEITLEAVLAAGAWTEALGGACVAIGEDDD